MLMPMARQRRQPPPGWSHKAAADD
jgi:hypothetical protein